MSNGNSNKSIMFNEGKDKIIFVLALHFTIPFLSTYEYLHVAFENFEYYVLSYEQIQ